MSLLTGFRPFGWQHLIVVLVCTAIAWFIIARARRARQSGTEPAIRKAWAWGTLLTAAASTIYWTQPAMLSKEESWPLHLCDIAAWLTPYFMLSKRRWPKTLLFFWGIGLSSQGFFTPTLEQGMDDPFYWIFWLQHLGVVGGGVYLAAVAGYRPRLADLALAMGATIALGLAMVPLNMAMDTNYMYVADRLPDSPTILDALGPWPMRLVWLGLLVGLVYTLVLAASEAVHRIGKLKGEAAG